MFVTVFVVKVLFIKSFTAFSAGEPINASVYGHVVISTSFLDECLCTLSALVHNTRVFVHVYLMVCTVFETFLTLITIKFKSS